MYTNIPLWLRQPKSRVYCTHKDKVPTNGTKINCLPTFYSFDEAISMLQSDEGLGIGLWGFLCGIDIDHCITDGVISPEALAILERFPEAYAERSFSGTGIHMLFLAPTQYKDKELYFSKMGKKHMKEKSLSGMEGLEFYQGLYDHRFFTLTGDVIQSPPTRSDVSEERIISFQEDYFLRPTPTMPSVTVSSDDSEDKAWLKWALLERRPQRLMNCWVKTPTGSGGTESEDDLAFMSELAFWSNKNRNLMRLAFEASRYFKAKDAKHKKKWARLDYSEGLISKACASGNVAKVFFEDSYMYDGTKIITKGGE